MLQTRGRLVALLAGISLAAFACDRGEYGRDTTTAAAPAGGATAGGETTGDTTAVVTAQLQPAGTNRTIGGQVEILRSPFPDDSGFQLRIRATGLPAGEHAWHIHSAACGTEAPVVVAFTPTAERQGLASALRPESDSTATETVVVPGTELTLSRLQGGSYAVHIHERGGENHGPTIACADL